MIIWAQLIKNLFGIIISGHTLTLDNERDDVFQKIYEFLME